MGHPYPLADLWNQQVTDKTPKFLLQTKTFVRKYSRINSLAQKPAAVYLGLRPRLSSGVRCSNSREQECSRHISTSKIEGRRRGRPRYIEFRHKSKVKDPVRATLRS